MNLTHLHLLLNHLPTVGFAIGMGLFVVSLFRKGDDLKRASLAILFVIALLAIPTYLTGKAAQRGICPPGGMETGEPCIPGVSGPSIGEHEDAALLAFVLMELTGFVAWIGLWQFRRISHLARWNLSTVLVLSTVTFGLMARAANIGGEIRHPEIMEVETALAQEGTNAAESGTEPAEAATAAAEEAPLGTTTAIGSYFLSKAWLWPAAESLHFVGLCLLFTVVLIVDLRMLGMAKNISFAAVYQLLPLGILGFGLNLLTGMLFFIAAPEQYSSNIAMNWKIACVVLAGVNSLYFLLFDEVWAVGQGDEAPLSAKLIAGSTIALWLGVLYFGHMLPFLGNAF